jgi:hypothetical protein
MLRVAVLNMITRAAQGPAQGPALCLMLDRELSNFPTCVKHTEYRVSRTKQYTRLKYIWETLMCVLKEGQVTMAKITGSSITLPLTPIPAHWVRTPHTHFGREFGHTHPNPTPIYILLHTMLTYKNVWICIETYPFSIMCQCLARASNSAMYITLWAILSNLGMYV